LTTMPRSAPSARIARGSLIQIAWGWSMGYGFSGIGLKSVAYVTCNSRPAIQGPTGISLELGVGLATHL
jgi:hypothetical protein